MRLVTVATVSYLYQVDVLLNSVVQFHPELKRTVLVADCTREYISAISAEFDSNIDFLCTDDLNIDFIETMRKYYSPLEFCSALKVLVSYYLLQSEDQCLFLDPDIILFASIQDSVITLPGEVVLCPHTFSPFPDDQCSPNNLELCSAGQINGGVFMTRRSSTVISALEWLVDKVKRHWFVAPEYGMYADQQWFTSLLFLFKDKTSIITDLGINVAYWNLHERELELSTANRLIIKNSSEQLRLFHFSGFPLPSNGILTKHSARLFDVRTQEILSPLIQSYESQLLHSRARLQHLIADISMCSLGLNSRLQIAQYLFNDDPLYPYSPSFSQRISMRLKRAFGYNQFLR